MWVTEDVCLIFQGEAFRVRPVNPSSSRWPRGKVSDPAIISLTAAFPPNGRGVSGDGSPGGVAPRQESCTAILGNGHGYFFGKVWDNDKFGTGSLVAGQRSFAVERRRRRLFKLVRQDGPRERAARKRAPVGADDVSQELDPGALCRARAHLLRGR